MAQPSGRIMIGIPTRYHLYLCSSPIICIADVLSMTIHFATIVVDLKVPPRIAIVTLT
jgi:hypothetical protein